MKGGWLPFCLLLSACGGLPSPAERHQQADRLAATRDWAAVRLPAGPFGLTAYVPARPAASDSLTIYIEGDGLAWINRSRPASDPTPLEPVGLQLALAQPVGNAAYLARPCQYAETGQAACETAYWTGRRFAPEVIEAMQQGIDWLKQRFGARRLALVGYSGGGAVAALAAARRTDVDLLVTIAGNLDSAAWTRLHRVSPLAGSLNPADDTTRLAGIRQIHLAGGRDTVVPPAIAAGYADRFSASERPAVRIEPAFDHRCCWVDAWPRISTEILSLPAR
jgi:dienelactone hydrolase